MAIIRFLDVGYGDTTIIESQNDFFLFDCFNIEDYVKFLPNDKSIKAVFITHQHYDHFLGLQYLKDNNYSIGYLISSPYKRRNDDNSVKPEEWQKFRELESHFKSEGTKIYHPYRKNNLNKPWWTPSGLSIQIIGPIVAIADKDTRELHDACLVITVEVANRKICFAGDASDESLNWIAQNSSDFCGDTLHASHHGSIKGADEEFLKSADMSISIISTKENVYENVPHSDALNRYNTYSRIQVLRTDEEGTIVWNLN